MRNTCHLVINDIESKLIFDCFLQYLICVLVFFKSSEFVSNLSKVLKLKAVYNLLFSESTRDAGISFGKPKLQYFYWLIKNNV